MMILTGVLAVLTALIWWQSFFQNNVTLFQKRMEMYQNYVLKYHKFVDFADECNKHIVKLNSQEFESETIKTKEELVKRFSDLEGATSPMMFVGFSNKINSILVKNIDDARIITDFLTQTKIRKTNVLKDEADVALDRLENTRKVDSDLNCLFKNELPLRNLKFYITQLFLKICPCCKHKG